MSDDLRDEMAEVVAGHTPDLINEGPNGEDNGKHWYCIECGVLANPEPSYGGEHVADVLLPVVERRIAQARAEAWDEGDEWGRDNYRWRVSENPYRQNAEEVASDD